jgi:hypothetical protein
LLPYIDSLIPWHIHKEDCPNPLARRLYIRDYDKNGKQRFVPWGLTCTKCNIIIQQKYEHNMTNKQKEREEMSNRLRGTDVDKLMDLGFGPKLSNEEIQNNLDHYAKNAKIAKRKAKDRKIEKKIKEIINRQLERAYIAKANYQLSKFFKLDFLM